MRAVATLFGHSTAQIQRLARLDSRVECMENTEEVVQEAVDILHLVIGMGIGAAITLAVGIALWIGVRIIGRRSANFHRMLRRVKLPTFALLLVAGAWQGLNYSAAEATREALGWVDPLQHGLLIFTIIASAWLAVAMAYSIEDIATSRSLESTSRRVTQAQMLRRVLQVLIALLALVAVTLTFPSARPAMASLLASAGVISLVAGIAAQDSLSNTFAGLQLTFTDALRVGDVIVVDGTMGTVEEVTLTYVVMRVWDERRIIVPSTHFTKNKFENLTRLHSKMLGSVELKLGWAAPMGALRAEVERLLSRTDLWDHRTVNIQVTDSSETWILVRVVVSAANTGDLWDLRCYLREHLVEWVSENAPYALARERFQREEIVEVTRDRSEEEIVSLARELSDIRRGGNEEEEDEDVPASKQQARLAEAKKRAASVRRKRLRDRKVEKQAEASPTSELTRVLSPAELENLWKDKQKALPAKDADEAETNATSKAQQGETAGPSSPEKAAEETAAAQPVADKPARAVETTGDMERLYSGDAEAEERSRMYAGPGEKALREREEAATLRAFRDGTIDAEEALKRLAGSLQSQEIVRQEAAQKRRKKD